MRRLALVALGSILLLAGVLAPVATVAAASASGPKVVLIVGATHGATSSYRSYMDRVYTAARRYTSNVVKVYSPNATWSAVQSAVNGARVVVYMGHGNGWPSPYPYDSNYTTKNGFGLNAAAGQGDSNNKYYGEPSIRTLKFAPNALVILGHLCYASGNSEPGNAAPSVSVAKQRIDGYANAFLRAGAGAVIADGHDDASAYIDALFSSHQTIEAMWRTVPSANGHAWTFAPTRSTGAVAYSDPDSGTGASSSGFYRSLVTRPGLRTDQVIGTTRTDTDPPAFTVPGAAEVGSDGAGLYQDVAGAGDPEAAAASTLAAGTRVRLLEQAGTFEDGTPIFQVRALADDTTGYVRGSGLIPRDSRGPYAWYVDDGAAAFSPNGDGRSDTITVSGRLSESSAWTVRFSDLDGTVLATETGSGDDFTASWTGLVGGSPVPDGRYAYELTATDGWGNAPGTTEGSITVDTSAPALADGVSIPTVGTIAPNGDGVLDAVAVPYETSESGSIDVVVRDSDSALVDHFASSTSAGSGTVSWDGTRSSGATTPDGTYRIHLTPIDRAGNRGDAVSTQVAVFGALKSVTSSAVVFYSQDRDAYAKTTRLAFILTRPATVTWEVTDAAGAVVYTRYAAQELPAGTYAFNWAGQTQAGAQVPPGTYYSRVAASSGDLSLTIRRSVVDAAYRITPSDSTPGRGQTITVTIVTPEPLRSNPALKVYQPGMAVYTLKTTKLSSTTFRATVKFKTGGAAGTTWLRVNGYDTRGGYNWYRVSIPLH